MRLLQRRLSLRRLSAVLVALVAGVVALIVVPGTAGADEAFYQPPSPLPAGEDGDVIRSQPSDVAGGEATRIMYLSRDTHGNRIPVTGTVIVPDRPWNGPGERPIVAYAPFTSGMGDRCAPSKTIAGEGNSGLPVDIHGLFIGPLLDRGIAVAQTDYEGFGTPGDHTYVIRQAEAHAVLDVLRAAQRLEGAGLPSDGPVGITGYSQGGGASAAAAELAASYAPELDVRGAYAGAPPADLSVLAESLDGSYTAGFLGFSLISLNAAYPELDILGLASDRGRELFERGRDACLTDSIFGYAFQRSSTWTADGRPVAEYLDEEPFASVVAEQRIGNIAPEVPVLVEHARNDDIVPYGQGRQMARDWCAAGAESVQFRDIFSLVPLFSHASAALNAATNSANWLQGRFSGTEPGSNCGSF
ncbi:lipase family protein [Streptomyces sp. DSM 44917]|uniref:Lipase family protein n=1 Tax=Streptomyces boetiae TaxID=3075541 RepID=A0ABU2LBL5_9ACTN|nr:lipase family protein [Streptomyces sp. DSM 44917]MDT0308976.1 lipase family protein [Streptomyces sp. DSM 44917]